MYPYNKGKIGHGVTHTGRIQCEEDRNWGDAFMSQGTPEIAHTPPEAS